MPAKVGRLRPNAYSLGRLVPENAGPFPVFRSSLAEKLPELAAVIGWRLAIYIMPYAPPGETMKIATYNVNGINGRLPVLLR